MMFLTLTPHRRRLLYSGLGGLILTLASLSASAVLVAEYRMDASAWSGVPGEVLDSSGSGFDGVANQTSTTQALLCLGADLSATQESDYLDLDHRALDGLNNFTLMMWYRSTNNNRSQLISGANAGEEKELYWQTRNGDRFSLEIKDDSDGDLRFSPDIDDGQWHHLAWTRSGRNNCVYIDGVQRDCNRLTTGSLDIDSGGFIVGQELRNLGYNFRNDRGVEGLVDELYIFDNALSQSAINLIRSNNLAGLNWDGSARSCATAEPRAAYFFDELSWSGVAGEVLDSSGNDYHGTAIATDTTQGFVCRAADFRTLGTSDYLDLDYRALDGVSNFTISAWIRSSKRANKAVLSGANGGQANEIIYWFRNANLFQPYLNNRGTNISSPNFWDGSWHHITWTHSGSRSCFYLDGALRGCGNLSSGTRTIDPGGLIVGQEQDVVGGAFIASQAMEGLFDELLIFDVALSGAEVTAIYDNNVNGLSWDGSPRTCLVAGAATFRISHDGNGIYCAAEQIGLRALDSAGATATNYTNTVVLDTGTGAGNWRLNAGNGVLDNGVAGDGRARYTFAAADAGEVWFELDYPNGNALVDIEVFQESDPTIVDDDSHGVLTFAPTGFTVTANALSNPPASPIADPLLSVTAGTDFDIHIAAYGTTDDDPVCGVIEDYAGSKTLAVWQDYVDPTSGTRFATLNGVVAGSSAAAPAATPITFINGQAVVTTEYKDAGRLRLNFSEGGISGSTDAFVSRPADLFIRAVTDSVGVDNPAAATATGDGFVAAGESFRVVVDALDADSDFTPNFGRELSAEGLTVSAPTLVLPIGGRRGSGDDGQLGNASSFVADAQPGRWENPSVFFDEVGVVQLQAAVADGNYLGTGPLLGSLSGNVGRFYPHHFYLNASSLNTTCGGFVYMSAPHMQVQAEIFARTQAGGLTANYDTTLLGAPGVAVVQPVAEHMDLGVDLGTRLNLGTSSWQQGEYVINAPSASFSRLSLPDGAYDNLVLGLQVNDGLDGRVLSVMDMDADSSGLCSIGNVCSARQIGTADVYYGRLLVLPAQGPETENLAVDLEAQIYRDGAFFDHQADQCSTYAAADVTLQNFRDGLSPGDTALLGPSTNATLVNGHTDLNAPLLLSAPSGTQTGVVELLLNVPGWLQFDWSGSGAENPRGDATFGRYQGHRRIIFWQQDP